MSKGFVYVLSSPNSDFIKIGGTERPVSERIREVNSTKSYKEHGPWILFDFLHVTNWKSVEQSLHTHFEASRIRLPKADELFRLACHEARKQLRQTDKQLRIGHDLTTKAFNNVDVKLFLHDLFQLSGLYGSLDLQGAWAMSVLPKTNDGRWFTLNIGTHEVAFSSLKPENGVYYHLLVLDRLLLDYPKTIMWVGKMGGFINDSEYKHSERGISVGFWSSFSDARKFFSLPGVRRALVAYWFDSIADLRNRNAKSSYARYHCYDAVAELLNYKYASDRMVLGTP